MVFSCTAFSSAGADLQGGQRTCKSSLLPLISECISPYRGRDIAVVLVVLAVVLVVLVPMLYLHPSVTSALPITSQIGF